MRLMHLSFAPKRAKIARFLQRRNQELREEKTQLERVRSIEAKIWQSNMTMINAEADRAEKKYLEHEKHVAAEKLKQREE